MIYVVLFFLSTVHASCLKSRHQAENTNVSVCQLSYSEKQGYVKCLACHISLLETSMDAVVVEKDCQPLHELHCLLLVFESMESYINFTLQFMDTINQIFDVQDESVPAKVNSLTIRIQNDTSSDFSLDSFRFLDQARNRSFCCVRFDLANRTSHLYLQLNPNIQNMTLNSIQINIYCQTTGLYQYNYNRHRESQPPIDRLECKLPDSDTTLTTADDVNPTPIIVTAAPPTKKTPEKLVLMVGLVGGGSLLPCLLLAACIYILCKRSHRQHESQNTLAESVWSDETASITSEYSY